MNEWKWRSLSRVWLFVTPWTIQSMEFSRPEYCSGEPFPSPGDLPNPRIKPRDQTQVSWLQVKSLTAKPQWSPRILETVAYPFSSGSSQPRSWTSVSHIAGRFFTNWAMREARCSHDLLAIHFQKIDESRDKFLSFPNSNCQKGGTW